MCLYAYNKQTVLSITACVAAPHTKSAFSSIATVHCLGVVPAWLCVSKEHFNHRAKVENAPKIKVFLQKLCW